MEHRLDYTLENNDSLHMPKESKGRVNEQYFKRLLREHKISQRKLAKLMDLDQASLTRSFKGKRTFQAREVTDLARIFNVPLEDVLRNVDIVVPLMRTGGTVAVTGQVILGRVQFEKTGGPKTVVAPPNENVAGLQAIRYQDEGALEGAYLYFRSVEGVAPSAIGRLCICRTRDAAVILATPRSSTNQRDAYTLRDISGRIIEDDIWLESASPVVWIKTA